MALIKAGTYRFADTLTQSAGGYLWDGIFTVNVTIPEIGEVTVTCTDLYQDVDGSVSYRLLSSVPDLSEYDVSYGTQSYVYGPDGWRTDLYGEGVQYITVPELQAASEAFGGWFTGNTYMACMPGKTGVTIEWDGNTEGLLLIPHPFYSESMVLVRVSDRTFSETELSEFCYWENDHVNYFPDWSSYSYTDPWAPEILSENVYQFKDVYVFTKPFALNGETIPAGVYFGKYIDGTDRYVAKLILPNAHDESTTDQPPRATVDYKGATIATLFDGQTATLKCAGMTMESDVVVEVAEQTESAVGLVGVRIEEV
jgi:hypothetical protein